MKFVLLNHEKKRVKKSLSAKQKTAFQEDVKGLKYFVTQLLSRISLQHVSA